MRTLLTSLALVVIVAAANATNPGFAVSAKAKNMSDVIKDLKYPLQAQQNFTEGKVLVVLQVNELGDVTESTVISYPCSVLKAEVERALAGLKFEPAKDVNGEAVASMVRLPIEFSLEID